MCWYNLFFFISGEKCGLAFEPIAEIQADQHSYGFRPRRSAADAIGQCFLTLSRKDAAQWTLEGDIKACFDDISHRWLMANILTDKTVLKQWLAAGYMEKNAFYETAAGTPQGGIISPTLANITLDGLAQVVAQITAKTDKVHLVRYADDFIITGNSRKILEQKVKPAVIAFLAERGLTLSAEKTSITHIDQGFDFLGFNVRKYGGKLLIKPAKKSVKAFLGAMRTLIKSNPTINTESLIRLLNPKLRGWANYYRHVVSKRTFSQVDEAIFKALCRWTGRRHPSRSAKWLRKKYFRHPALRIWQFHVRKQGGDNRLVFIRLFAVGKVKIKRHVKIRAAVTPYDSAFIVYFEQRKKRTLLLH